MVALVPLDWLFHSAHGAHHWRRLASEAYCCSLVCRWARVRLELRRNWPRDLPTESVVATGYREERINAAKVQTQEGCSCSAALVPRVFPRYASGGEPAIWRETGGLEKAAMFVLRSRTLLRPMLAATIGIASWVM